MELNEAKGKIKMKWDHLSTRATDQENIKEILDLQGEAGWELAGITESQRPEDSARRFLLILKRPHQASS